jgi:hypothetical protein
MQIKRYYFKFCMTTNCLIHKLSSIHIQSNLNLNKTTNNNINSKRLLLNPAALISTSVYLKNQKHGLRPSLSVDRSKIIVINNLIIH